MLLRLSIILIVFTLFSCNREEGAFSVKNNSNDSLITDLNKKGLKSYYEGNYVKSQSSLSRADSLITENTDTVLRIQLLFNITELLKQQGEYEKCIENYYEAVKLSKLISDSARLGLAYYNITSTYIFSKKFDEASNYNLKAQNIFKNIPDVEKLTNCYVQYSIICKNNNKVPLAREYLNKAIKNYEEANNDENLSICLNNYGNILLNEDKFDEALDYYTKAVSISRKLNHQFSLAIRLGNISELYLSRNQLPEAKAYIDSSMVIAEKNEAKETILSNFERLANYYKTLGNLDSTLNYTNKYIELKTELLKLESTELVKGIENKYKNEFDLVLANNEIKLLQKDKLVSNKEQEQTNLVLYFVLIISLLIIIAVYILYKKQIRIRLIDAELHKKEREMLEAKNNLASAELEKLEKELEFKRKELMTFSFNLKEREELINSIKNIFSKSKQSNITKQEVFDELKGILFNLNRDSMVEIHERIEEMNSSFFFNLKTKYPELSDDDIRLASLLLIGLSSKEIANILNIEPKSVDQKRYRLKKKLKLETNTDLKTFLEKI